MNNFSTTVPLLLYSLDLARISDTRGRNFCTVLFKFFGTRRSQAAPGENIVQSGYFEFRSQGKGTRDARKAGGKKLIETKKRDVFCALFSTGSCTMA